MIKYNEAQKICKTYGQIVERLQVRCVMRFPRFALWRSDSSAQHVGRIISDDFFLLSLSLSVSLSLSHSAGRRSA